MLTLDKEQRNDLWIQLSKEIELYLSVVDRARIAPDSKVEEIALWLERFDFQKPIEPQKLLERVTDAMWTHQTHVSNPRYFGLFNPAPSTMGIIADTLIAAFNPQAGSWKHSPLAVQLEHNLIRTFGERFGLRRETVGGVFCTGGSEANHTAILTALVEKFPQYLESGLSGSNLHPALYVTSQTHHSIIKLVRLCGLGSHAVRFVEIDAELKMNPNALKYQIERDTADGFHPFMVVATAGTTNAGVIDPLLKISEIAKSRKLWFHVDAAWGGGAALFVPQLKEEFRGIEQADSITYDAHKWMSVPMSAGIYLTSHDDILKKTFTVPAEYMSGETAVPGIPDPYAHSLQWSRRFIGLKIFMSLAAAGWKGYETVVRKQIELGDLLRAELRQAGWQVANNTVLPVICFADNSIPQERAVFYLKNIARRVVESGEAWISWTYLSSDFPVLRACITNYKTGENDVIYLTQLLEKMRETVFQTVGFPRCDLPLQSF
jgi:glutamate/tyrosine decarboxylase-like PLP-dependent enzyme